MTGVSFPSCTLRTPLSTDEDLSSSRLPPHTPTLRNMLWSTHPRALSRPLIAITICVQPETLDYRHYTNHYCLLLLLVVATACKCAWYLNSYIRETIDGRRWCRTSVDLYHDWRQIAEEADNNALLSLIIIFAECLVKDEELIRAMNAINRAWSAETNP